MHDFRICQECGCELCGEAVHQECPHCLSRRRLADWLWDRLWLWMPVLVVGTLFALHHVVNQR